MSSEQAEKYVEEWEMKPISPLMAMGFLNYELGSIDVPLPF